MVGPMSFEPTPFPVLPGRGHQLADQVPVLCSLRAIHAHGTPSGVGADGCCVHPLGVQAESVCDGPNAAT